MRIGAIQKFSMIDYPGKLAAVIFTQGCNFRCPYCHNPELVKKELFTKSLTEEEIFNFLKLRVNKLEAVCITGGEPTLHPDLPHFIEQIKELGFLVKLDTNGTNPAMIKLLIHRNLVDYFAMDIKAPLAGYKKVLRTEIDIEAIKKSIELITNSNQDYEFRTTLISTLHSEEDVRKIIKSLGKAKKYYLQKFVPTKTLDESFLSETTFSDEKLMQFLRTFDNEIDDIQIR